MDKAVFFQAVDNEGTTIYVALAGQMLVSRAGADKPVKTDIQVILRDNSTRYKPGTIFGTNSLTPKSEDTYYVVGPKTEVLTDEKGAFLDAETGSQKEAWQRQYDMFKAGGATATPKKSGTMSLLELFKADVDLAPPTIEDDGFYVDPEIWHYLARCAFRKKNIILLGATGVGKTEIVALIAEKLGKYNLKNGAEEGVNLDIFDMAISNPVTTLCGNHRIIQGESVFEYARFARCIPKAGIKLLDELSRANPAAANILLPLTDKRRTLYIENAMGHDTEIKLHDSAMMWATANIGMQYIGTNGIDDALMNRFEPLELLTPPVDKMVLILEKRAKVDKRSATMLANFANEITNDRSFSKGISPRQLISAGELVADGFSIAKAIEHAILHQFDGEGGDGGEKGKVKMIIQKM